MKGYQEVMKMTKKLYEEEDHILALKKHLLVYCNVVAKNEEISRIGNPN